MSQPNVILNASLRGTMSTLLNFLLSKCDQFKRGRLPSLYSDFTPQRYSNPDGFLANVEAWRQALATAAQASMLPDNSGSSNDTLSLVTGDMLLQALETKEWGRPLALETVIDESILRRQMMPYQDFIKEAKDIHSWDWKVQPWWFLSWTLRQIGALSSNPSAKALPNGHFVIIANVENASAKVLAHVATETNEVNRIYPMNAFREMVGKATSSKEQISANDLTVLLTNLSRDKGAIVHDQEVVKFKAAGDISKTVSMEDKTIASLKTLISELNGQIDSLFKTIESLTARTQEAVKRKDRISALATLKSKKLKESALSQRTDTLSQVEEVLQRIEQAQDQVTMVKIMKASTTVLQGLRRQAGGIDEVEKVVENLRDEMQQVDEIGKAMEAGGQSDAIDDDIIDEELESMMRESKAKEEEKEAQATQRRLAEIENSTADMHQPNQPERNPVEADTAALKRLSIKEVTSESDLPKAIPTD